MIYKNDIYYLQYGSGVGPRDKSKLMDLSLSLSISISISIYVSIYLSIYLSICTTISLSFFHFFFFKLLLLSTELECVLKRTIQSRDNLSLSYHLLRQDVWYISLINITISLSLSLSLSITIRMVCRQYAATMYKLTYGMYAGWLG